MDEEIQAIHYEALLKVIEKNKDWFRGVFWWNWVTDDAFNEGENSKNKCMDPKWKKAEKILRKYYNATMEIPRRNINSKQSCSCVL